MWANLHSASACQAWNAARQRHADLEALIERQRADADTELAESTRRAARLVEEAEQKASTILADAKTAAARVRADSDRELAAATQRRDSINAQLANVRQMLVTLTGSAPVAFMDDPEPVEATTDDPAPAEAPDPVGRCQNICDLSAATCDLEGKICDLAARHSDDPRYADLCRRADDDCRQAAEACQRCSP